ncbi:hypothetical protein [Corynebacterium cystitidis]|uniref:hypothetical protein n=1 Tax=Corynebacterium cystitidis TaxID=35757 RepID=UPI00211E6AEF|nr:hypothetical protein [Corynebacterium cystitidis]
MLIYSLHLRALPNLLLGVLAVGALLAFAVSIIGRVPSGFQVAGIPLEFKQGDLTELIEVLRVQLGESDELVVIEGKLAELVGQEQYRKAIDSLGDKVASSPGKIANMAQPVTNGEDSNEKLSESLDESIAVKDRVESLLGDIAGFESLERGYTVKGAGRGQPPKLDFFFKFDGRGIGFDVLQYTNQTILTLASNRASRSLGEDTDVDFVVFLVPASKVGYVNDELRTISQKIYAVTLNDLEGKNFENRLSEILKENLNPTDSQ